MRRLGFLFRVAFPPKPLSRARPQVAHVLPTTPVAPATRPPGGTIGDGWAEPDVDIEDPLPADEPTSEGPAATVPVVDEGRPLAGCLRVVLAMHADGLTRPGVDVAAWVAQGEAHAKALQSRGWPASWEFTAREVKAIEATAPGWLAGLHVYGIEVAAREPHQGDGTAEEAHEALLAAGVLPAAHLGSCLHAGDYIGRRWPILTGEGSLGHTADADWSGVRSLVPGYVLVGSGTANSVAKKRGIAREVAHGAMPFAIEVIRYNGMDPKTGGAPWFASPARHDGAQAPVPILDDVDRVMGEIANDGNAAAVLFTTYGEAVAAWRLGGEPAEYVVPKS